MNAGFLGLLTILFVLALVVLLQCARLWRTAGPRERSFLWKVCLLLPIGGGGFSVLLWGIAHWLGLGNSPTLLYLTLFTFGMMLTSLFLSRRLTLARREDSASPDH